MLNSEFLFLKKDTMPSMLREAVKLIGITEIPGPKSNPKILEWVTEIGGQETQTYRNDDVAWCGLFVAICVHRSGRKPIEKYLWARNWAKWGVVGVRASLGDILVFKRGVGGHVGFYTGETDRHYYVLGGNQANSVNIMKIEKTRIIAIRRPVYTLAPFTAVPIMLSDISIKTSTNEA
jgi:uncharacterized protein (TIGR02594 family)